jgi:hypothetical protein
VLRELVKHKIREFLCKFGTQRITRTIFTVVIAEYFFPVENSENLWLKTLYVLVEWISNGMCYKFYCLIEATNYTQMKACNMPIPNKHSILSFGVSFCSHKCFFVNVNCWFRFIFDAFFEVLSTHIDPTKLNTCVFI